MTEDEETDLYHRICMLEHQLDEYITGHVRLNEMMLDMSADLDAICQRTGLSSCCRKKSGETPVDGCDPEVSRIGFNSDKPTEGARLRWPGNESKT